VFISNQKECNLLANIIIIIQVCYNTVYYYDMVGYLSSGHLRCLASL